MITGTRWMRIAGAAGLIYVVLLLVSSVIGGLEPEPNNRAKVTKFFIDHHDALVVRAGLTEVSLLFFLCFLLGLVGILRRAEGGAGVLSALALGGGAGYLILALMEAILVGGTAFMVTKVSDSGIITALADLHYMTLNFLWPPLAVMLGAAAYIMYRTLVLPQWFALVGFVAALFTFLRSIGVVISGGPYEVAGSYFAFLAWVALAGIVMLRYEEPARVAESDRAAQPELTST